MISFSSVYAVGIDMNLDNSVNNAVNNSVDNNVIDNSSNNAVDNTNNSTSNVPKMTTSQTSEEFSLSVSDIIDIILIAFRPFPHARYIMPASSSTQNTISIHFTGKV